MEGTTLREACWAHALDEILLAAAPWTSRSLSASGVRPSSVVLSTLPSHPRSSPSHVEIAAAALKAIAAFQATESGGPNLSIADIYQSLQHHDATSADDDHNGDGDSSTTVPKDVHRFLLEIARHLGKRYLLSAFTGASQLFGHRDVVTGGGAALDGALLSPKQIPLHLSLNLPGNSPSGNGNTVSRSRSNSLSSALLSVFTSSSSSSSSPSSSAAPGQVLQHHGSFNSGRPFDASSPAPGVPTITSYGNLRGLFPPNSHSSSSSRFSLSDYDWLGFDMDHTLVAYKQGPFNRHMMRAAARLMLEASSTHGKALLESARSSNSNNNNHSNSNDAESSQTDMATRLPPLHLMGLSSPSSQANSSASNSSSSVDLGGKKKSLQAVFLGHLLCCSELDLVGDRMVAAASARAMEAAAAAATMAATTSSATGADRIGMPFSDLGAPPHLPTAATVSEPNTAFLASLSSQAAAMRTLLDKLPYRLASAGLNVPTAPPAASGLPLGAGAAGSSSAAASASAPVSSSPSSSASSSAASFASAAAAPSRSPCVIDFRKGNILFLDSEARVAAALHGSMSLSRKEIRAAYYSDGDGQEQEGEEGPLPGYYSSYHQYQSQQQNGQQQHQQHPSPQRRQSSLPGGASGSGQQPYYRYGTVHTGFDEVFPLMVALLVHRYDAWLWLRSSSSSSSSSSSPSLLMSSLRDMDYAPLVEAAQEAVKGCYSPFCSFGFPAVLQDCPKFVESSASASGKHSVRAFLEALRKLPLPPKGMPLTGSPTDTTSSGSNAMHTRRIRTFLLTNASYEHANILMSHAYGGDWLSLFDLVVVDAKKKRFFQPIPPPPAPTPGSSQPSSAADSTGSGSGTSSSSSSPGASVVSAAATRLSPGAVSSAAVALLPPHRQQLQQYQQYQQQRQPSSAHHHWHYTPFKQVNPATGQVVAGQAIAGSSSVAGTSTTSSSSALRSLSTPVAMLAASTSASSAGAGAGATPSGNQPSTSASSSSPSPATATAATAVITTDGGDNKQTTTFVRRMSGRALPTSLSGAAIPPVPPSAAASNVAPSDAAALPSTTPSASAVLPAASKASSSSPAAGAASPVVAASASASMPIGTSVTNTRFSRKTVASFPVNSSNSGTAPAALPAAKDRSATISSANAVRPPVLPLPLPLTASASGPSPSASPASSAPSSARSAEAGSSAAAAPSPAPAVPIPPPWPPIDTEPILRVRPFTSAEGANASGLKDHQQHHSHLPPRSLQAYPLASSYIYSGGNVHSLQRTLAASTFLPVSTPSQGLSSSACFFDSVRVLFFGDHIAHDVVAPSTGKKTVKRTPRRHAGAADPNGDDDEQQEHEHEQERAPKWDTVAIIPELAAFGASVSLSLPSSFPASSSMPASSGGALSSLGAMIGGGQSSSTGADPSFFFASRLSPFSDEELGAALGNSAVWKQVAKWQQHQQRQRQLSRELGVGSRKSSAGGEMIAMERRGSSRSYSFDIVGKPPTPVAGSSALSNAPQFVGIARARLYSFHGDRQEEQQQQQQQQTQFDSPPKDKSPAHATAVVGPASSSSSVLAAPNALVVTPPFPPFPELGTGGCSSVSVRVAAAASGESKLARMTLEDGSWVFCCDRISLSMFSVLDNAVMAVPSMDFVARVFLPSLTAAMSACDHLGINKLPLGPLPTRTNSPHIFDAEHCYKESAKAYQAAVAGATSDTTKDASQGASSASLPAGASLSSSSPSASSVASSGSTSTTITATTAVSEPTSTTSSAASMAAQPAASGAPASSNTSSATAASGSSGGSGKGGLVSWLRSAFTQGSSNHSARTGRADTASSAAQLEDGAGGAANGSAPSSSAANANGAGSGAGSITGATSGSASTSSSNAITATGPGGVSFSTYLAVMQRCVRACKATVPEVLQRGYGISMSTTTSASSAAASALGSASSSSALASSASSSPFFSVLMESAFNAHLAASWVKKLSAGALPFPDPMGRFPQLLPAASSTALTASASSSSLLGPRTFSDSRSNSNNNNNNSARSSLSTTGSTASAPPSRHPSFSGAIVTTTTTTAASSASAAAIGVASSSSPAAGATTTTSVVALRSGVRVVSTRITASPLASASPQVASTAPALSSVGEDSRAEDEGAEQAPITITITAGPAGTSSPRLVSDSKSQQQPSASPLPPAFSPAAGLPALPAVRLRLVPFDHQHLLAQMASSTGAAAANRNVPIPMAAITQASVLPGPAGGSGGSPVPSRKGSFAAGGLSSRSPSFSSSSSLGLLPPSLAAAAVGSSSPGSAPLANSARNIPPLTALAGSPSSTPPSSSGAGSPLPRASPGNTLLSTSSSNRAALIKAPLVVASSANAASAPSSSVEVTPAMVRGEWELAIARAAAVLASSASSSSSSAGSSSSSSLRTASAKGGFGGSNSTAANSGPLAVLVNERQLWALASRISMGMKGKASAHNNSSDSVVPVPLPQASDFLPSSALLAPGSSAVPIVGGVSCSPFAACLPSGAAAGGALALRRGNHSGSASATASVLLNASPSEGFPLSPQQQQRSHSGSSQRRRRLLSGNGGGGARAFTFLPSDAVLSREEVATLLHGVKPSPSEVLQPSKAPEPTDAAPKTPKAAKSLSTTAEEEDAGDESGSEGEETAAQLIKASASAAPAPAPAQPGHAQQPRLRHYPFYPGSLLSASTPLAVLKASGCWFTPVVVTVAMPTLQQPGQPPLLLLLLCCGLRDGYHSLPPQFAALSLSQGQHDGKDQTGQAASTGAANQAVNNAGSSTSAAGSAGLLSGIVSGIMSGFSTNGGHGSDGHHGGTGAGATISAAAAEQQDHYSVWRLLANSARW